MTKAAQRARLKKLVAEMTNLTTPPRGTDRSDWDMTEADCTRFDQIEAEADDLRSKLADAELGRTTTMTRSSAVLGGDDAAGNRGGFEPPNINRGGDPFDGDTIRIDASSSDLRARVETGLERDVATPDDMKTSAMRTLHQAVGDRRSLALRCLATGSPAYRTAFAKLMTGNQAMWNDEERQAVARAQSLTDAAGGFAVPFTLDSTIVLTNDSAINPIRRLARVVQITTDSWNGVTSAGTTASWDAEAAEVSDDSLTLAQPSIPVHKAQNFIPFSIEIGQDWAGIENDLRMTMVDARDRLEATAHAKGTGSGQPTGIEVALDGTASELAPSVAETFAAADVYATQRALPARYRPSAEWVLNLGTVHTIRQFDTAGGGDFWTSLGGGTPERLLGMQSNVASEVDDSADINAAATEDNFILFVGDWSKFVIVDRVGMNIELVPHLFGAAGRPTGQRGLYAWWRTGADSIDDNAFRVLSIPTTA